MEMSTNSDVAGEELRQLGQFASDILGHLQRIAAGRDPHRDESGRLAVHPGKDVVVLRAKFDPGHILDPDGRTIRLGAHDDVAELFRRGQAAARNDHRIELLARSRWRLPDFAGRDLHVLGAHRVGDIGR